LELIFTFIGTIIGAGFASGQEIRKYFVDFGGYGALGIVIVSILFMIIGEKIMLMGYTRKADSYDEILGYGFRCKFKRVIDYCLCFFLVATASTMFSGTGAFFNQFFDVNFAIGSFFMAVISCAVVIFGIKGIMKISSFIVPILILLTCAICILSFGDIERTLINEVRLKGSLPSIFSALIYGSYNIIMGLSILPALGSRAKNEREIRITSVLSGLIIGIFAFIIYFALFMNYDKIQGAEIPVAVLAGETYSFIYGVSFIIAVLTTAVGCLYGVYTRFNKNVFLFCAICMVAYFISLFGFSVLVARLYYIMGIFGIFLITMLVKGYGASKKRKLSNKEFQRIKKGEIK